MKIESFDLGAIHSQVHFYYLCVSNDFLKIEEVLDQIQTACDQEMITSKPIIVYYLLLYFAPNLKEKNKEYYCLLCENFEHSIKLVAGFSKSLLRHWGHLPERLLWINECIIQNQNKIMDKEEWKERNSLLKNGFLDDTVESIIMNDDVDKLQELIVKNHVEIDDFKCKDSFLLFQEFFDMNELLMLQQASIFQSINCFKYLFLNKSKPDSFYNNEMNNLMLYAVKGGNPEIIRILYQKKFILKECLYASFLFFHHDVFQWLFQFKNKSEEEFLKSTITKNPSFSYNLRSVLFLYQNNVIEKESIDQFIHMVNGGAL